MADEIVRSVARYAGSDLNPIVNPGFRFASPGATLLRPLPRAECEKSFSYRLQMLGERPNIQHLASIIFLHLNHSVNVKELV